jgi:hypothetical protein
MRERAAQELNPEMGRMGAEDPSTAFSAAPLHSPEDGDSAQEDGPWPEREPV